MSAKNRDRHNRFRSITVGFRVSPEEQEQLNRAVALSGLPKQEYCYRKCMDRTVTVQPNPRVYKALKDALANVLEELKRISAGAQPSDELLEDIALITTTLNGMKEGGKTHEHPVPQRRRLLRSGLGNPGKPAKASWSLRPAPKVLP